MRAQLVRGDVVYRKTVSQSVLPDQDRAKGVCLPCRAVPVTDAVIRLNRTDRLARGPYSDWLASRDLKKAGRGDAPDHIGEQRMSVDERAPTLASTTTFHEREADLTIKRREDAADGVVALTLVDPSGAEVPEWSPGAHVDVILSPELLVSTHCAAVPATAAPTG